MASKLSEILSRESHDVLQGKIDCESMINGGKMHEESITYRERNGHVPRQEVYSGAVPRQIWST